MSQNSFIQDIKEKVKQAQYEALKTVNVQLTLLYWEIGKSISEKQKESWGKSVVETLSKELQQEFPKMSGFSTTNLWYMTQFYTEYQDVKNLQPLVGEISWTKNLVIFTKCKDNLQREFYIQSTKKFGWTKDLLIHQIENKSYEKFLLNQTNFNETLPEKIKNQALFAIKDEYTFDFLGISDEYSEHQLEESLIKNVRKFLIEMGSDFTFIGNQYKLMVSNQEYYIDLLLFHRKLQSLVAIELKIGAFKPEYKGKMEYYLNILNDQVKMPHENDSIGLIICKSKDRTIVEYSLKSSKLPIGVASYELTETLPDSYKGLLPDAKDIEQKFNSIFNINE